MEVAFSACIVEMIGVPSPSANAVMEVMALVCQCVNSHTLVFYQSKSGCVNERYLVDITIETELLTYCFGEECLGTRGRHL